MIGRFLDIKNAVSINTVEWHLRRPWPSWIALALVALACIYALLLYRRQAGLSRPRRIFLGLMRATLLSLLVVMFFQPVLSIGYTQQRRSNVLVLLDRSQSMSIKDQRQRPQDRLEAAWALGRAKPTDTQVSDSVARDVSEISRSDLARGIFAHPDAKLGETLAQKHSVRTFGFGRRLEPTGGEGPAAIDAMLKLNLSPDDAASTELGTAMDQAVASYSGQPIAGMILVSDGGSNGGPDAVEVARQLGRRNIPVYTVGVGMPSPPDVAIKQIIMQDVAFVDDRATVRVQLQSSGFERQTAELRLLVDGREADRRRVTLGDGFATEDLSFVPLKPGTLALRVEVVALAGETFTENNVLSRSVKVSDEKIKVLYVEGKPRWEYRYLREVLLRDRRLTTRFLMTQGDPDLARYDPERYIDRFPDDAAGAFKWDLVIIGDVPSTYFRAGQVERIQELVRDRGGSMLMLAGHRFAPASYGGSALAEMLPVRLEGAGLWPVDGDAAPVVTPEGMNSAAGLETSLQVTNALWSTVRPLYQVPQVAGLKKGAVALLTLPRTATGDKEPYPLVCWQRYGTGKCMYVGTDSLWRLRFKQGDKYHARFWGQSIQFLTLSRLLGGNRRITISTDRQACAGGERVQVFANVLDSTYEPVRTPAYTVAVKRPGGELAAVRLESIPDAPGMYQGFFNPTREGQWMLTGDGDDAANANSVNVEVRTIAKELRDPAMQEQTLRKIAEVSGGKYIESRELASLASLVRNEPATVDVRLDKDLWDLPLVFALLVVLAGTEWYIRRRSNLL